MQIPEAYRILGFQHKHIVQTHNRQKFNTMDNNLMSSWKKINKVIGDKQKTRLFSALADK